MTEWRRTIEHAVAQVLQASRAVHAVNPADGLASAKGSSGFGASKVVSALEQFQECVRYLNTRRSSGAVININNEADLQDVLFLMLRPWLADLVAENPTDKVASRYVIKDFLTRELGLVIEAKFVRDRKHGKLISEELHDDIENYRNHPDCKDLIFFIYDPDALIPDVSALKRQIAGSRAYAGRELSVCCVVKP